MIQVSGYVCDSSSRTSALVGIKSLAYMLSTDIRLRKYIIFDRYTNIILSCNSCRNSIVSIKLGFKLSILISRVCTQYHYSKK